MHLMRPEPYVPCGGTTFVRYEHYPPGGQTAVNIGGEHFQNPTREFVVPSGSSLETGTVVFELKDGGVWDIVGVYGR